MIAVIAPFEHRPIQKKTGSIILTNSIQYGYLLHIRSILPSRVENVAQRKRCCDDEVKERRKKRKDLVGDRMKERCTGSLDSTWGSVFIKKIMNHFSLGREMKGAVKARRCVSIQPNYKYTLIPRLRTVKMIFSIRLLRNERCMCSFFSLAVSRVIEIMER